MQLLIWAFCFEAGALPLGRWVLEVQEAQVDTPASQVFLFSAHLLQKHLALKCWYRPSNTQDDMSTGFEAVAYYAA